MSQVNPSVGKKVVLGVPLASHFDAEDDLPTEPMTINMGPSHPAMHGTVRIVLTVEGETIKEGDVQIGFLHRCFEKESEHATWTQVFPYTDRLNYVSPMLNNVGYAMAVEKLCGITSRIPERAQYIRVIVGEMARVADHLTCTGAGAMELGALSLFFHNMKAREWIWELLEEISGARLTHSYVRVGGVFADLPEDFPGKLTAMIAKVRTVAVEVSQLLVQNRIFRDRMDGVGIISAADAIAWGWTGPALRSTGVAYDVRKDHPYCLYDRFDFDVPIGSTGDNYDRFACRMEEIEQSLRILEQALLQIAPGPIVIDDPRVVLPPRGETYNTIEGMINHFKIIVDGIKVPAGEVYSYTEGGNGELGFYIVSDGTGRPYRCRVRPPCFAIVQALPELIKGMCIADIVPTFGMMNMIGGEMDR
ncbi:MAG: NADH-quinone oxidoreductase subunit D [Myxococcales bacterium]|nr:NADH-quinone oxidoreductase subunit D [Myxococcales bacterium]